MDPKKVAEHFPDILAATVHDMKGSLVILLNQLGEVRNYCQEHHFPVSDELTGLEYEVRRLNHNLVKLLTLYKLGNWQNLAELDYVLVADFINEQLLEDAAYFRARGVQQSLDCSEALAWFMDPLLLKGVLGNAISNAVRYTRKELALSAREEDGYLVIRVEDDGDGYPEAMLSDSEAVRSGEIDFSHGTTGLGLYFAQLIASLHSNEGRQGRVELSNGGRFGGGCFAIYLP